MVVYIGHEQTVARPVNYEPNVAIDTRRPEIGVLALIDAVQLETVAGRVDLQIEDACLHSLLVHPGQAVERRGERVGDQEVHQKGVSMMSGPIGTKVFASLELPPSFLSAAIRTGCSIRCKSRTR
jgi:hypothetical protein